MPAAAKSLGRMVSHVHLLARTGSIVRRSGSVTHQQFSPMLGVARPHLAEQVGVFAAVHRSPEHGIEPAMETPRVLLKAPADRKTSGKAAVAVTSGGAVESAPHKHLRLPNGFASLQGPVSMRQGTLLGDWLPRTVTLRAHPSTHREYGQGFKDGAGGFSELSNIHCVRQTSLLICPPRLKGEIFPMVWWFVGLWLLSPAILPIFWLLGMLRRAPQERS
jgi:hypothetical protein